MSFGVQQDEIDYVRFFVFIAHAHFVTEVCDSMEFVHESNYR